jgi:hypothetical protein
MSKLKIFVLVGLMSMKIFGAQEVSEELKRTREIRRASIISRLALQKPYKEATHEELQKFFRETDEEQWNSYAMTCADRKEDSKDVLSKIQYLKEERRALSPVSYYPNLLKYIEHDFPYIYMGHELLDDDAMALYGCILMRGLDAYGYHVGQDIPRGARRICSATSYGSRIGRYVLQEVGLLRGLELRGESLTAEDYQRYCMEQPRSWYKAAERQIVYYYEQNMEEIKAVEHLSLEERIKREVERDWEGRKAAEREFFALLKARESKEDGAGSGAGTSEE